VQTPFGLTANGRLLYVSDWDQNAIFSFDFTAKTLTKVISDVSLPMALEYTTVSEGARCWPHVRLIHRGAHWKNIGWPNCGLLGLASAVARAYICSRYYGSLVWALTKGQVTEKGRLTGVGDGGHLTGEEMTYPRPFGVA